MNFFTIRTEHDALRTSMQMQFSLEVQVYSDYLFLVFRSEYT